ncbi:CPBP family intramembrane glutamic endopeptidase [Mucilaginibacter gilvus]|uniref:CPBP family intramembrane metalloprotease n=1 Tax=Mucilaginibacter gilvus TaxID=2305909 RepID=A0A3S3WCW3_9SPHI|nr:type II CAAX endopeptidase family protein [Mucilaginibacter gilvus]RWY53945.1 CPBP family intramembrane metalloprotease [Mucilaginibacter gilvus]
MQLNAEQSTSQHAIVIRGMVLTVLFFFIISFVNRGINAAIGISEWSPLSFTISRFFYWVWLALIFVYAWRLEHQPLLLWPEKRYGAGFYLASVFGILLTFVIGTNIIAGLLMVFKLFKRSDAMAGIAQFSILLKVFISLTAAVVEEFVFRGYLMPRLQLFYKSVHWPVIITSVLFGLAHMRWGTIVNVLGPMFIGFIFAYHYQKYRNIKVLMACHFLWDIVGLILIGHTVK